jgi:lipoprotein-anchoring transpeptidase ErfK/SrfK
VALLLAAAGGAIVASAYAAPVPASVPLVMLHRDHVARSAPRPHATRLAIVTGRRPLTNVPTVLPVLGRATSPDGRHWLRVALPGRPNQGRGWITADHTTPSHTHWRLAVELDARRVLVYHLGQVVRRFRAVVGAPSTPTPRGRFFIEEAMSLGPLDAGGPFALATSARSDVLQEFDGGPGQIALHGRNHLSGALGTAASHGCIRLSTRAITWLSQRIGAGVPLTVTR